jgi:DNA-binding response OmpR family regulator
MVRSNPVTEAAAAAEGTKKRILVIEDEPDIVRGLRDALEFEGFEVQAKGTGAEGLIAAMDWAPDAVLLDLMLPDDNGYRVCETLRQRDETVPIIILTAKAQESDKIRGLDAGADDYVTKPFSVAELIARINAIFRRQSRLSSHRRDLRDRHVDDQRAQAHDEQGPHEQAPDVLRARGAEAAARAQRRDGVARRAAREGVGRVQASPTNRTVDNFIVKLRRKLEEDQKNPRHILTVYGLGYKLVP